MDLLSSLSAPPSAPIESPILAPSNAEIAEVLERVSAFLGRQRASVHRTSAWSRAAAIVRGLDRQARDIVRSDGVAGLVGLPGIGARIARAIDEMVRTRGLSMLARLEGDLGPDAGFTAFPGPPTSLLLEVDERYRARAAKGDSPRVAPRRFNPSHEAWLPVLHEEAQGWHLHAMFSNTARAHELDRTNDWVVIFGERDGVETQATVVTEQRGPRAGKRVVRGREDETR